MNNFLPAREAEQTSSLLNRQDPRSVNMPPASIPPNGSIIPGFLSYDNISLLPWRKAHPLTVAERVQEVKCIVGMEELMAEDSYNPNKIPLT